jgi:hypothetical protein
MSYTDIGWTLVIGTVGSGLVAIAASFLFDLWATLDTKRRIRRMAEAQRNVSELLGRTSK